MCWVERIHSLSPGKALGEMQPSVKLFVRVGRRVRLTNPGRGDQGSSGLKAYNVNGLLPNTINYSTKFGHHPAQECARVMKPAKTKFVTISSTPTCGTASGRAGRDAGSARFDRRCVLVPPLHGWERLQLLLGEEAGTDQEPHPLGSLYREAAAPTGHHIDREMRVFPVFVLFWPHVKRRGLHVTEENLAVAYTEVIAREAHWTGTVATSA
jgi:hypothetical protein